MQSLLDQGEAKTLVRRYGVPLYWTRMFDVTPEMLKSRKEALETSRGEVVFVIPRPQQRILLQRKSFYPEGTFRLLSGKIKNGEGAEAAVVREIAEETGFRLRIRSFLGLVEYEFAHGANRVPWVSYVMLMDETEAAPRAADRHEQIAEWRDVNRKELEQTVVQLRSLPTDWADWGRFRAVAHRLVLQAWKAKAW